jgi:protein-disulfide isomerase
MMSRRREEVREKARAARDEQRRRDRRNRALLQGGLGLGAAAVIGIIVVVLLSSVRAPSGGPLNMRSDGILLGRGFVATGTPGLAPGEQPVPSEADGIPIRMYIDYICPFCQQFEETNADYIASLVDTGEFELEIHPISIRDASSQGTKYSTRAANAAVCVANYAPNRFYEFHAALFANQPEEGTAGLTNEELAGFAADFESAEEIRTCIVDEDFSAWVNSASDRALRGPLPDADVDRVIGTPTVIVNGQKYQGAVDDPAAFRAFVVQVTEGG